MQTFFSLMGWLILLVGLTPVVLAGIRGVQASKMGRRVWPWVGLAVLCIPAFFLTAFVGFALLYYGLYPFSSVSNQLPFIQWVLFSLAGPWAAWLIGRYLIQRSDS